MNLNSKNKGTTFKFLIKSTDIDKDVKKDDQTVEKSVEISSSNIDAPQTELKDKSDEALSDNQEKIIPEKEKLVTKKVETFSSNIPKNVNKDLDFVPEEDTDEEEEEKLAEKVEFTYDPVNVRYENEIAIYTDPKSGYQYTWDKETNEWKPKGNIQYGFEDDTHTYTDGEGVKYFWDKDKSAWFPKIDDDFMAQYQMSYGFVDNTTKTEESDKEVKIEEEKVEKVLKRKAPTDPTWFDVKDEENRNVYVSNLPTDITEEEFVDFMQKCGLVMRDMATGKMKVKLYVVPGTDILKGDALCTYIKLESVDLALNVLDGYLYREKRIKVERAKFEMKGDYNPTLKPKKKKKKEKEKLKKMQEKLFDWRPDKLRGERAKHERIVIVKNVFDPDIFDKDVGLILEYQQDLREECSKCGEVKKVILFDRHPEGVAQINMKEPEMADQVVTLLNGRWFGQRKLTAEIWDGRTKFKIAETDSQISKRISEWDKFLEADVSGKGKTTETKIENETTNDTVKTEINEENKVNDKDEENKTIV